ncbi:hypothetical protein WJX73_007163 [Symbiochloris irregularis]|uniref:Kinesin-like protein n=1 Tax=Symbiochloris irregularis TaxID=706552 RepID=A0AAW1PNC9_9CHLO
MTSIISTRSCSGEISRWPAQARPNFGATQLEMSRLGTPPPRTATRTQRPPLDHGDLPTPPRSAQGKRTNELKIHNSPSGKTLRSQSGGISAFLPPRTAQSSTLEQHNVREQDNIKVVVRVRPMNERETTGGETLAVQCSESDTTTLQINAPGPRGASNARQFAFHGVLPPGCRQSDVLQACGITQLLDAALAGFHVTIFAYGQTGSGKTFTMSGREDVLALESYAGDSDDGIVTRAVMYLYESINKRGKAAAPVTVKASYCEIYNEALYDLLKFSKQQLSVRWDAQRGFHCPDLSIKDCAGVNDLMQVISRGMRNRRIGSHELNLESSRSHSIVTVYCNTAVGEDNECARFGKISFVDLAGSERVKDTHTTGEMLKETTSINRSLFTLGKVISALAEREAGGPSAVPHIPYRDSKLTKLLMDSLGGSALALMVACVSPASNSADETLSTLSYAARAKNIRNQPVVQLDAKDAAIAALKREVALLRAENQYLHEQLESADVTQLPGTTMATPEGNMLAMPDSTAPQESTVQPEGTASPLPAVTPGQLMTPRTRLAASLPGNKGIEPLIARINEAENLLMRYSKENERLASLNSRLQFRRQFVDTDYTGALEEVDWLRHKLERIEGALKDQVTKPGQLARILSRKFDADLHPKEAGKEGHGHSRMDGHNDSHLLHEASNAEELTEELGALLTKIAAHARAEPGPPISLNATIDRAGSLTITPEKSFAEALSAGPSRSTTPPRMSANREDKEDKQADGESRQQAADKFSDNPGADRDAPASPKAPAAAAAEEETLPRPVSRRGRTPLASEAPMGTTAPTFKPSGASEDPETPTIGGGHVAFSPTDKPGLASRPAKGFIGGSKPVVDAGVVVHVTAKAGAKEHEEAAGDAKAEAGGQEKGPEKLLKKKVGTVPSAMNFKIDI